VVITQNDTILRRREQVYQLHWKGKSSREIASVLGCSFKTVCNDITWLENTANEEIKEQRKHIALEYKEACDIFKHLLGKALEQFEQAEKDKNADRMERLYPIIESLNANRLSAKAHGDLIEQEVIEYSKRKAGQIDKGMTKAIDKTSRGTNQAIV
jgi:transposase